MSLTELLKGSKKGKKSKLFIKTNYTKATFIKF